MIAARSLSSWVTKYLIFIKVHDFSIKEQSDVLQLYYF
jgi:hypothetical protein